MTEVVARLVADTGTANQRRDRTTNYPSTIRRPTTLNRSWPLWCQSNLLSKLDLRCRDSGAVAISQPAETSSLRLMNEFRASLVLHIRLSCSGRLPTSRLSFRLTRTCPKSWNPANCDPAYQDCGLEPFWPTLSVHTHRAKSRLESNALDTLHTARHLPHAQIFHRCRQSQRSVFLGSAVLPSDCTHAYPTYIAP